MSPNAGGGRGLRGEGWGCGVSANEYNCAHEAQINFGDLTPYLKVLSNGAGGGWRVVSIDQL
jgi:hypothetical protein